MAIEHILDEIQKELSRNIRDASITSVEVEAAHVVVYTKRPDRFVDHSDTVRTLAKNIKKRIVIRPDPCALSDVETAIKVIKETIPDDAEITDIYFEPTTGEVFIEAKKPGLAIGKFGSVLDIVKKKIGWAPKVIRTPPIKSKTIKDIREFLRNDAEARRTILRNVGRRIYRENGIKNDWVRLTSLGGFREVGRTAMLLTTPFSRILIDCGVNMGSDNQTPYLQMPEIQPLTNIDAVIVTHAHLDHCGLVPFLFKCGYDGPVYCTPPTRDLMTLLQIDFIEVAAKEGKKSPYESTHVRDQIKHTITLDYDDTADITPDVKLTLSNAGHILGSSIAHFHIGEGYYNFAYTGDFKYENTWLFDPAVNKFQRIETVVMESTYGGSQDFQPSRNEAANQIKDIVGRTLKRKGKVVIPVFAVGRSQEAMIVIESLMRSKQLPRVPVYLDGMIWEATAIHTAYPEYLNSDLRRQIFVSSYNPFLSDIFSKVDSPQKRESILNDTEPCIVLATSGMLNGGPIMEYIKQWAGDEKTTLIFVGFQAEGTTGRKIQRGIRQIESYEGGKNQVIELKLNVETCDGLSGHSDRKQLMSYIQRMEPRPERILTCHGDNANCIDLASSLHKKFNMETRSIQNLETIRFR